MEPTANSCAFLDGVFRSLGDQALYPVTHYEGKGGTLEKDSVAVPFFGSIGLLVVTG